MDSIVQAEGERNLTRHFGFLSFDWCGEVAFIALWVRLEAEVKEAVEFVERMLCILGFVWKHLAT
jgi:hypothetical protein